MAKIDPSRAIEANLKLIESYAIEHTAPAGSVMIKTEVNPVEIEAIAKLTEATAKLIEASVK